MATSTVFFDRLHRAIWELAKRNPGSSGAQQLKNSWQKHVADKRSTLSKVPGYWDDLMNKYWNWYAREYNYPRNPRKPPSPLTPQEVQPAGGFLERKTQEVLLMPAAQVGQAFSADAERRMQALARDTEIQARALLEEAKAAADQSKGEFSGAAVGIILGGAVLAVFLYPRVKAEKKAELSGDLIYGPWPGSRPFFGKQPRPRKQKKRFAIVKELKSMTRVIGRSDSLPEAVEMLEEFLKAKKIKGRDYRVVDTYNPLI